jgi:hypothetical protein
MRLGLMKRVLAVAGMAAMTFAGPVAGVAQAQMTTVDPNDAIDADLAPQRAQEQTRSQAQPQADAPLDQGYDYGTPDSGAPVPGASGAANAPPQAATQPGFDSVTGTPGTPATGYQKDDLIGAAEGVFGKGAEGLAGLIEDILRKQGEPNGYIIGREASGAFVVGLRYGSGTLHHKVEGEKPVYWTGPSIGFDAGANAGNTFVLVYNLYDSEELYKRFGAGEGAAYLVGGFHTSYLRRGDVVLIPVRMGLGLRLGVNAGYMKFTRKRNFVPF